MIIGAGFARLYMNHRLRDQLGLSVQPFDTHPWPDEGVELRGERVGVIGTRSSGVQSIPVIGREAERWYGFQRPLSTRVPARHHAVDESVPRRDQGRLRGNLGPVGRSLAGLPLRRAALDVDDDGRLAIYEDARPDVSLLDIRRSPIREINETGLRTEAGQQPTRCLGANIPGKPCVFMPYPGGVGTSAACATTWPRHATPAPRWCERRGREPDAGRRRPVVSEPAPI